MKKYELTKKTIQINGKPLYRIKATKNFGSILKNTLGGFIESESNLSHDDNCWISGDAKVYGNAIVFGNAQVYDDAKVYGNAQVYGNANVYGNAIVYGDANVYGNAIVFGNANVSGKAIVYGNAYVSGNAKVSENHFIVTGYIIKSLEDKQYSLFAQLGILPDSTGNVILYKKVIKKNNRYFSEYNNSFEYIPKKFKSVKNPDISNASCSSGIHLSMASYWQSKNDSYTLLECRVNMKDIITIQQGKVRCKKCYVIREIPNIA